MKLIINGITDSSYIDFENKLESNIKEDAKYFKLRDMTINYCQGCWDCWVKTPGKCVLKDDYESILSEVNASELITVITPILVGYESSLIKTFSDRIIPIIHPYIEIKHGEQHHVKRYESYPDYKLIVLKDEFTTDEDITAITELYKRKMLNLKAKLIDVVCVEKGADLDHVINGI